MPNYRILKSNFYYFQTATVPEKQAVTQGQKNQESFVFSPVKVCRLEGVTRKLSCLNHCLSIYGQGGKHFGLFPEPDLCHQP